MLGFCWVFVPDEIALQHFRYKNKGKSLYPGENRMNTGFEVWDNYLLECWLTKWKVYASVQTVEFCEIRSTKNWVKTPYLVRIQCDYYTLTWFACQCVNIVTVWFFVGFMKNRKKSEYFGYWKRQDSQGKGVPGIWSKDAFIMRKTAIRKRFCVGFYVGFSNNLYTFAQ